ncbi:hypothetical protein [Dactylosporangium sp. CA-233914]|uniref:hypothetical protein n=1 Tax=Dactylosporangium sp. CA-233914 TaxID=3239934 RepID=UPI003D8D454B
MRGCGGSARCLWIERSLDWLLGEVLTPTDEHFPGAYEGSRDDAEALVRRRCRHMGVDRASIELEHEESDGDPRLAAGRRLAWSGAAGHYRLRDGRAVSAVRADLAAAPMALVATVAHELGHGAARVSSAAVIACAPISSRPPARPAPRRSPRR